MGKQKILKIRSLRRLSSHINKHRIDFSIKRSEKIMQRSDWAAASKGWEQIINKYGSRTPSGVYVRLSLCYRRMGKYAAAQKIIDKGKTKYPDYYPMFHEDAEIATDRKDWDEAAKRWNSLLPRLEDYTNLDMLARVNRARQSVSIEKRLADIAAYKKAISEYQKARRSSKSSGSRIAVFTAIAGKYDYTRLPETLDPDVDYIIFTDQPVKDTGIYKVMPLPYFHLDPTRSARFVKTHAPTLLAEYDIAIWLDANVMIAGKGLSEIIKKFIKSKKPVGALYHPLRKSVFEEAEACIERGKEDKEAVIEQITHYKEIGFNSNDLIESNFMAFDLKNKKTKEFLDIWWTEIDRFTKRDQLSINYALKKSRASWHPLLDKTNSVRNHPSFIITSHHSDKTLALELEKRLAKKTIKPFDLPNFKSVRSEVVKKYGKDKIDVVVCVHNALEDVKICLDSIEKHRINPNLKLIIIDDGSAKETADYLRGFAAKKGWVKLVRNEKAGGYTKAANLGMKTSTGDLVILLNSDTIVTDGWAEKMADAAFSKPNIGLVGPLSSAASHQSIPEHMSTKTQTATNELPPGITVDDMNELCEKSSLAYIYPLVPLVHGVCFGITRQAMNKLGYFDKKNFPRGYSEENDYCFRAMNSGFCLTVATNTYIFHAKSKSYSDEARLKLQKEGSAKLKELYGAERIKRAILSMKANPLLERVRDDAQKLYDRKLKTSHGKK